MLTNNLLYQFFTNESDRPKGLVVLFAVITGISNGLLLAVINQGSSLAVDADAHLQLFLLYVALLALFIYTKRYTLAQALLIAEETVRRVRCRIGDKLRHTELEFIESIGPLLIHNRLTQDTSTVSQSAGAIFNAIESAIMLFFAMVYVAWLTFDGFLVTLAAFAAGMLFFLSRRQLIFEDLESASEQEVEFFNSLDSTLEGFKELKVNQQRSDALFAYQTGLAEKVKQRRSEAGVATIFIMIGSQLFFYLLLAVLIFVWPTIMSASIENVIKLTAVALFIIGPVEMLVATLPMYIKAQVSVENLNELEKRIDAITRGQTTDIEPVGEANHFQAIELKRVHFSYRDQQGANAFSVGPVDLSIRCGETIFIVGGNGSGKSTLLKLLTGLYYADGGEIVRDGERLEREEYQEYRNLFSIVFTDFHLFPRLYGLEEVDPEEVRRLLREMDMASKSDYEEGSFTNIDLSTGQRKRLALITALLDSKQICVFDELAADQDPQFRRRFYREILPALKEEGITVIAVTHDDRYFDCADRVYRMDEGQLEEWREET